MFKRRFQCGLCWNQVKYIIIFVRWQWQLGQPQELIIQESALKLWQIFCERWWKTPIYVLYAEFLFWPSIRVFMNFYKNIGVVCVKETSPWDVSLTHTKHMFDWKKLIIIFFFFGGGGGGGDIFLCIPAYNTNFRYFKVKSLAIRTSNLRVSTVVER